MGFPHPIQIQFPAFERIHKPFEGKYGHTTPHVVGCVDETELSGDFSYALQQRASVPPSSFDSAERVLHDGFAAAVQVFVLLHSCSIGFNGLLVLRALNASAFFTALWVAVG